MKTVGRRLVERLRRHQAGFTLVELLVVVGIIVALAAVIVPNVAQFAGQGTTGAMAAESENVQTAIDTYMADGSLTSVTANNLGTTGTASNDFTAATGIIDLETGTGGGSYLRTLTTTYYYCWDTTGLITEQFTSASACTV